MTSEEIIKKAFKKACQYLQYNPPAAFSSASIEELRACAGSGTYEDGWKQWAKYFINEVLKDEI